ncbi:hypothetical protein J6590_039175 [Homalodisca vitripennis]|nr:hypothetical protein J6590_039175 [Homalodisca vitripennis]
MKGNMNFYEVQKRAEQRERERGMNGDGPAWSVISAVNIGGEASDNSASGQFMTLICYLSCSEWSVGLGAEILVPSGRGASSPLNTGYCTRSVGETLPPPRPPAPTHHFTPRLLRDSTGRVQNNPGQLSNAIRKIELRPEVNRLFYFLSWPKERAAPHRFRPIAVAARWRRIQKMIKRGYGHDQLGNCCRIKMKQGLNKCHNALRCRRRAAPRRSICTERGFNSNDRLEADVCDCPAPHKIDNKSVTVHKGDVSCRDDKLNGITATARPTIPIDGAGNVARIMLVVAALIGGHPYSGRPQGCLIYSWILSNRKRGQVGEVQRQNYFKKIQRSPRGFELALSLLLTPGALHRESKKFLRD